MAIIVTLRFMPCHRLHARTLFWRGKTFPLCARCTGIFLGFGGVLILAEVGISSCCDPFPAAACPSVRPV
ncbi:DUF2085 domain-containing protein [Brevibacillus sp. SYP-B805]|nr:DUF2085 domain-containing protein [Brevibacillus sp. SYP-B805]